MSKEDYKEMLERQKEEGSDAAGGERAEKTAIFKKKMDAMWDE